MEGGNGEGVECGNSVFYRFRHVCVVECVCQFRNYSHSDHIWICVDMFNDMCWCLRNGEDE